MMSNRQNNDLPMSRHTRQIIVTTALVASWIGALTGGIGALARYENHPGTVGASPDMWPANSRIARSNDRYTLVMLAHPRCPCTRASMSELAQIMAQVSGKVNAYVLFLKPRNSGSDWDDTDLFRRAKQIPNVTVLSDLEGEEAHRFGAETSGHALLFAASGKRIFSGGVTASRGHEGANVGENAIVSLVKAQPTVVIRSTSVFGCPLASAHR
jgi:hypothetical protein